jgi:hypothetical protein
MMEQRFHKTLDDEGGKIMKARTLALGALVGLMALAGCATQNSSIPASTGIGAGAGALLGYGLTGKGTGAAAGAGAGALAGALTGLYLDESRARREAAQSQQAYHAPPPRYQHASQTYATQPDPTFGQLINDTRWRLEIFVDDSIRPLYLGVMQSQPLSLDIGPHRVVAKAFVQTQFGERLVGTSDRTLYVDPRGAGWSVRFDEAVF